ncbi:hypothetical protein WS68_06130 [Burkholderia sp. TSV86]|nr:hypothetical protein WS68_06130 [Burkholderia sp. TSV86]
MERITDQPNAYAGAHAMMPLTQAQPQYARALNVTGTYDHPVFSCGDLPQRSCDCKNAAFATRTVAPL